MGVASSVYLTFHFSQNIDTLGAASDELQNIQKSLFSRSKISSSKSKSTSQSLNLVQQTLDYHKFALQNNIKKLTQVSGFNAAAKKLK